MASAKKRPGFSRVRPSRARFPVKLVLAVEGETERAYLRWVADEAGLKPYEIETMVSGVPRTCAVDVRASKEKARQLLKDGFEILAATVCDTDEHPAIPEARDICSSNGIFFGISNPSTELWFLIHYRDQTAFIERTAAKAELKKHCTNYEKGDALVPALAQQLRTAFDEARKRAEKLRQRHRDNGSSEFENPSTNLDELVVKIRELAKKATGGQ